MSPAPGPSPVVDADGHVLEPADTWEKYIDPAYRDRAIRIARDEQGYEVLLIDGQPLKTLRGALGALGGIEMDTTRLLTRGQMTYAEGSPAGGYDPVERLRVMDGEGIDSVLLYPTIGICWEGHVSDGGLATAYTRAYNRWLADFCRTDPRRLHPVAHVSLLDPEGAVQETIRARRDGCVGIFLSPDLAARGGRHFDDPLFARFWETAQELEMPIAFHVVVRDRQWFRQWQRRDPSDALFSIAFLAIDVMAAFTQMLSAGMFERYPRLKCAVLEAGSNWIAAWLDRLDHKYRIMKDRTPLEPSAYFFRQCLISADPDESVTAQMVEHLGADYFIWASDYPHIDASFGVVRELKERLAPLSEEARRKVLGENAQRFYRLTG
ncbi:MAG TPA: amidohydrolase family protein [Candidatus Nitrosocosmicus sp.]|nr:amidohydrolase family protein [Candidatus Nitrosocosmicus sp.]